MIHPFSQISRRHFFRLCSAGAAGLSLGKVCHRGEIRAGLDIGTSSICVAVGKSWPDGRLHILGLGEAPSRGILRHGVADLKEAESCINEALVKAERASGVVIRRLVLGVVGTKLSSHPDDGGWDRILSMEEPCHLVDAGDGLLRALKLDGQGGPPASVTIVAGAGSRIQAVRSCLVSAGVEIECPVLAPAATASLVLDPEQRRLGALLMDIGEGTTDYAVYAGGKLLVADCIARGLEDMDFDESIESTFRFIRYRLQARHIRIPSLHGGVHLVGGGSLQPRVIQAARQVFGLQTKAGTASDLHRFTSRSPVSPRHLAAAGLIHWQPQPRLHA
jgi:cell division ATPase FtsA